MILKIVKEVTSRIPPKGRLDEKDKSKAIGK